MLYHMSRLSSRSGRGRGESRPLLCGLTKGAAFLAGVLPLAACSGGGGSGAVVEDDLRFRSEIVTLNDNGTIPNQNISLRGTRGSGSDLTRESDGEWQGFAYQYGRVRGSRTFLGVAGIAPGTDPGEAATVARASYEGRYDLAHADTVVTRRDGDIRLDADFANGTLTGSADGLEIDGRIDGTDLSGRATFRGVSARLDGVIGTKRAVGAFAGNDDDGLLVGGIVAEPD
jgi:hypothetical protein